MKLTQESYTEDLKINKIIYMIVRRCGVCGNMQLFNLEKISSDK